MVGRHGQKRGNPAYDLAFADSHAPTIPDTPGTKLKLGGAHVLGVGPPFFEGWKSVEEIVDKFLVGVAEKGPCLIS